MRHPELTHPENYRVIPHDTPTEGVGIVEAPRGTLMHHYVTDENGIVRKANLVVGTTNNHAAICMSIKKAAQGLIRKGVEVDRGRAEHDRDGVPRLRPVLRLRHPQPARADADGRCASATPDGTVMLSRDGDAGWPAEPRE